MNRQIVLSLVTACTMILFGTGSVLAGSATKVDKAIWAHGTIYGTIATPTSFNLPPVQSTDTIYSFMLSGLTGQRSVSESAPGDRNYNGGRWSVKVVLFTDQGKAIHDPDNDGAVNFELTSAEKVLEHEALGHLTIMDTSIYFECPLLKS
ncbi:hypothetical protein [Malonomonas rubra]|uniref:hypothetical protein n=1 Tax=Malonomonas rubra TaxID=57040 RepID=UPI0026EAEBA7|nr:hypothetical protein [Malonomonas rubra]